MSPYQHVQEPQTIAVIEAETLRLDAPMAYVYKKNYPEEVDSMNSKRRKKNVGPLQKPEDLISNCILQLLDILLFVYLIHIIHWNFLRIT